MVLLLGLLSEGPTGRGSLQGSALQTLSNPPSPHLTSRKIRANDQSGAGRSLRERATIATLRRALVGSTAHFTRHAPGFARPKPGPCPSSGGPRAEVTPRAVESEFPPPRPVGEIRPNCVRPPWWDCDRSRGCCGPCQNFWRPTDAPGAKVGPRDPDPSPNPVRPRPPRPAGTAPG